MVAIPKFTDIDHQETDEWIESLHSVIERDGVERAHFLLESLIDEARRVGANLPYSANTAYLNTIPESREAHTPGDPAVEWRIRSLIRWNALGDGGAGQPALERARRAHRELRLLRDPLRRGLQPLLARTERAPRRRLDLHPGALRAGDLRARPFSRAA